VGLTWGGVNSGKRGLLSGEPVGPPANLRLRLAAWGIATLPVVNRDVILGEQNQVVLGRPDRSLVRSPRWHDVRASEKKEVGNVLEHNPKLREGGNPGRN